MSPIEFIDAVTSISLGLFGRFISNSETREESTAFVESLKETEELSRRIEMKRAEIKIFQVQDASANSLHHPSSGAHD